jgi:hypothetical protein
MSADDRPDPAQSRSQHAQSDPFGDVLPERSRDEEAEAWGDDRTDDDDQRLSDEVPPHHA